MLRSTAIRVGVLIGAGAFAVSTLSFCSSALSVYWYTTMVDMLHGRVFRGQNLYAANCLVPGLDNVDQRLVMDSRTLCNDVVTFTVSLLTTLGSVVMGCNASIIYGWMPIALTVGYDPVYTQPRVLVPLRVATHA